MGRTLLTVLRFAGAAFAGYVVIVLGTTLVLEVWFEGNVKVGESSLAVMASASAGNFLAGILGGFVAAWLGGRRPLLHAIGVWIFLAIDTGSILLSDRFDTPAWFTLLAGASLMAAALLGGVLRGRFRLPPTADEAPAGRPAS